MSRKNHHNDEGKQNENSHQQQNNSLFSEVDAKHAEDSGYTLVHAAPNTDKYMYTSIGDIDESIVLSTVPSSIHGQYNVKRYENSPSSDRHNREHVHLPPITHQHYPYEYFCAQPNHSHSHPQPVHYRYRSPHHYQHRYHKHQEMHDPRWWYMPINSVHGPKSRQLANHHHYYSPPKWYELPNRQ